MENYQSKASLLALVLLALLLAGCHKIASGQIPQKDFSTGNPVTVPKSWPLPNLIPPAGSIENPLGMAMAGANQKDVNWRANVNDGDGTMWVMGFKNDLDIEAVAQYLESCLDMKTFHQTRNADFGNSHYIDWESADEKYSIGLQYSDKMLLNDKSAPIGAAFFSGYILKVTVWKK